MKVASLVKSISLTSVVLGLIACGQPSVSSKDVRHGATGSAKVTENQAADEDAVYLINEAQVGEKVAQAVANPEATAKQVLDQSAEINAAETVKSEAAVQTVTIASTPVVTTTTETTTTVAPSAPVEITSTVDKNGKTYLDIRAEFAKKLKEKPGVMSEADADYLSENLAGFVDHGGKKCNKEAAAYWNKFAKRVHELAKVRAAKKMGIFPILFGLGALVAAILAPAAALVAAVAAPILIAPFIAVKAAHNVVSHVFRVIG